MTSLMLHVSACGGKLQGGSEECVWLIVSDVCAAYMRLKYNITNIIMYVSTTYLLKHRLYVSTQH